MSSVIVQLAKDFLTWVKAQSLSQEFDTKRAYRTVFALEEQKQRYLIVVYPGGETVTPYTRRKHTEDEYSIDVVVQRKISPRGEDYLDELDGCMDFVQEVRDVVINATISDMSHVRTEVDEEFHQDQLDLNNLFYSIQTFTFKTIRG